MTDPSSRRQPITAKHDAFAYATIDHLLPRGYDVHGDPDPLDEDTWIRMMLAIIRRRGLTRHLPSRPSGGTATTTTTGSKPLQPTAPSFVPSGSVAAALQQHDDGPDGRASSGGGTGNAAATRIRSLAEQAKHRADAAAIVERRDATTHFGLQVAPEVAAQNEAATMTWANKLRATDDHKPRRIVRAVLEFKRGRLIRVETPEPLLVGQHAVVTRTALTHSALGDARSHWKSDPRYCDIGLVVQTITVSSDGSIQVAEMENLVVPPNLEPSCEWEVQRLASPAELAALTFYLPQLEQQALNFVRQRSLYFGIDQGIFDVEVHFDGLRATMVYDDKRQQSFDPLISELKREYGFESVRFINLHANAAELPLDDSSRWLEDGGRAGGGDGGKSVRRRERKREKDRERKRRRRRIAVAVILLEQAEGSGDPAAIHAAKLELEAAKAERPRGKDAAGGDSASSSDSGGAGDSGADDVDDDE